MLTSNNYWLLLLVFPLLHNLLYCCTVNISLYINKWTLLHFSRFLTASCAQAAIPFTTYRFTKINGIKKRLVNLELINYIIVVTAIFSLLMSASWLVEELWLCWCELWHSVINTTQQLGRGGGVLIECHNSRKHNQNYLTTG